MPMRFLLSSAAAAGVLVVRAFSPCTGQTAGDVAPRDESGRPARSPLTRRSTTPEVAVARGLGTRTRGWPRLIHYRVFPSICGDNSTSVIDA
jgi:hypothetical protein